MVAMLSSAMEEKSSDEADKTYGKVLDVRYKECLKTCEFYKKQSRFFSKDLVETVCVLNCLENYLSASGHEMARNMRDEIKK